MGAVRFNAFQRIMRLWDTLHPYNAVQVMKLEGKIDGDRLADAWAHTLSVLGLGRIYVNGSTFRHETFPVLAARDSLRVVDHSTPLDDHISDEINQPFPIDDYCPFRPFVLPADGAYFAGVVYQHWVADSVAVRTVLREWFLQSHARNRARSQAMRIPAGGYWEYFGPHRAGWQIGDAILATMRLRTRFCRVRQMRASAAANHHVRFSTHPLPDGLIDALLAAARRQRVTLNDLCLAAVAEACHQHGATPPAPDRDELALGTIVDLRAMATHNMDDLFGMFLGFMTTVVRDRDAQDFPTLLRRIAAQNAGHKRSKAAQSSVLRMAGALLEASLTTPEKWADVYRLKMPMAGGMSNVNMNRTWAADHHPSPLIDYVRVAPTGPTIPVVFSITTLGRKFNFGLTRRIGLMDNDRAIRLSESVIHRFTHFAFNG